MDTTKAEVWAEAVEPDYVYCLTVYLEVICKGKQTSCKTCKENNKYCIRSIDSIFPLIFQYLTQKNKTKHICICLYGRSLVEAEQLHFWLSYHLQRISMTSAHNKQFNEVMKMEMSSIFFRTNLKLKRKDMEIQNLYKTIWIYELYKLYILNLMQ